MTSTWDVSCLSRGWILHDVLKDPNQDFIKWLVKTKEKQQQANNNNKLCSSTEQFSVSIHLFIQCSNLDPYFNATTTTTTTTTARFPVHLRFLCFKMFKNNNNKTNFFDSFSRAQICTIVDFRSQESNTAAGMVASKHVLIVGTKSTSNAI